MIPVLKRLRWWFVLDFTAIFALSACSLISGTTPVNAETAIAQTVAAQLAQSDTGDDQPASITPELEIVTITVSVDTNCRSGPDAVYDKLGVLVAGETAQVVGRRAVADYWIIQNPDSTDTCWLWGMYATLHGNTDLIPEMTPPPTPTVVEEPTAEPYVDFSLYFFGICDISGLQFANIQIVNTGTLDLESSEIYIVDNTSHTDLYGPGTSNGPFRATVSCSDGTLLDTLPSGSTVYIRVRLFDPVSGHAAVASIMLCSGENISGNCITKSQNFYIP